MSYTAKFTNQTLIEAELQFTFNATSSPTNTQLAYWIEEEENKIDNAGLGQATATNITFDVENEEEEAIPPTGTIGWFEALATYRQPLYEGGRVIVPPLRPIVSVTKLYRRTSDLDAAAVWEELTEGPGANSDFVVLQNKTKVGLRGFAFYIYDTIPYIGYKRMMATYIWGLDLPAKVLAEYATLRVAKRVLLALSQTSNPNSLTQFTGGSFQAYVPTQYQGKWSEIDKRIEKWEAEWISKPVAVGVFG